MKKQTTKRNLKQHERTIPQKILATSESLVRRSCALGEQALDLSEADDIPELAKIIAGWWQEAPLNAWLDHERGCVLSEMRLFAAAIPILRRAVERMPDCTHAKAQLAIALLLHGEGDEAEELQAEVLAMEPNSFHRVLAMACTLVIRGKCPERGEALLRRAIQLRPDQGLPWGVLGDALSSQGRWREAHTALWRAIRLDQDGRECRRIAKHFPHMAAEAKRRLKELARC